MTKSWLTGDIKDAAAKKGGLHQFLGIYEIVIIVLIGLSIIGIGITDYGNTLSAVRMGDEKVMNDRSNHLGKDGSAMKQPILSLRNSFLFLLTVFLLNLPGTVMAGSAAQIALQVEILQDTNRSSQERSAAAQELGVVGLDSDAAAQALVEIIENDSDPKVRASAAKALGMVGLPQAAYIQTLIQTLQNNGSPEVRYAAAEGLRIIGVDSP